MISFRVILIFIIGIVIQDSFTFASCPGCLSDMDVNDGELKRTLNLVMSAQNTNDELLKIISAKYQIVAGIRYVVKFEVKNPQSNQTKTCTSSYVVRKWISPNPESIDFSCE
uniref:Venom cystatin 1 n=1 Tax=Ectomocoris sp. TaxID=3104572 RepID=A0AB38ZEA8_9HEMI